MLTSSLLTIAIVICSSITNAWYAPPDSDYDCPATTTALGPFRTRFERGVIDVGSVVLDSSKTIDDCEALCRSTDYPDCVAFEYSYRWYRNKNQCTLYDNVGPVTQSYIRIVSACALNQDDIDDGIMCPPGTTQGGPIGTWPGFINSQLNVGISLFVVGDIIAAEIVPDFTIEECRQECCARQNEAENSDVCTQFAYFAGLVDTTIDGIPDTFLTSCYGYNFNIEPDQYVSDENDPISEGFIACVLDNDGIGNPPLATSAGCPAVLECPAGSDLIGSGQEIDNGQLVDSFTYKIPEECEELCKQNEDCFFFLFDPSFGSGSVCQLYQVGDVGNPFPAGSIYEDSIICEVESCPDGSTQIGGNGDAFDADNCIGDLIPHITLEQCEIECQNEPDCCAYQFDYDVYYNWYLALISWWYPNVNNGCWLFSDDTLGDPVPLTQRDALLCKLNSGTSAKSVGLLNFEGITNEIGATKKISVSAYIIYGVIGLVLINIICLIIHCWKKNKDNGKRYKVVSVPSDDDSTDI